MARFILDVLVVLLIAAIGGVAVLFSMHANMPGALIMVAVMGALSVTYSKNRSAI